MSVPGLGTDDAPAVTGSIAPPIEVQQPIPQTLAYSDVTKIGLAADATLWQAGAGTGDWINSATGSSGSVASAADEEAGDSSTACRSFSTIVTSVGGVHSYNGRICRAENGRPLVQLAAPELPPPL
jgi:hypothetical protein